jgi:hypothetical protein
MKDALAHTLMTGLKLLRSLGLRGAADGEPAQGTMMVKLLPAELRQVIGGDLELDGPRGGWVVPPITQ